MRAICRPVALSVALFGTVVLSSVAGAQPTYEMLHSFRAPAGQPRAQLIEASNGILYGVTPVGGAAAAGTVFALERLPGGGTFTILHEFDGLDGRSPASALIEGGDGALYGTTPSGGAAGLGTIFKITPLGDFTLLHTFTGPDGAQPLTSLVEASDGNFYGTTHFGGTLNLGTVFRLAPDGTLTTVYSFVGGPGQGGRPRVPLIQATDGDLYGITSSGSEGNLDSYPMIFRMTLGGVITTLRAFDLISFDFSTGLVQGTDGDFYGILQSRPIPLGPVLFKITASGDFTEVSSFGSPAGSGTLNPALTLAADGNFYATFVGQGPNVVGTALRLTPEGVPTIVHAFTPDEGRSASGVIQGGDGLLYGTTESGGIGENGIVFSMTLSGTLTTLHRFFGKQAGLPVSALTRATDGRFYLTTAAGGLAGLGTLSRMSPDGVVTVLHSFTGADGASPAAALLEAADGFFYGTTVKGGCANQGTVFRMSASGEVTSLHCFTGGNGSYPIAALIQATDGMLYGTTLRGGAGDRGSVFRFAPGGALTTVHSFAGDSVYPVAALMQASDGNFYGTTAGSDEFLGGSVFQMTPWGSVSVLYVSRSREVTLLNGIVLFFPAQRIQAGLTEAADGTFISASCCEGSVIRPQIFRITTAGTVTPLFTGPNNTAIVNAPILGHDGNFYGTASHLAADGGETGSIYRLSPAGDFTYLKTLTQQEGELFIGTLLEASDGVFYGTAARGGAEGRGVIFRFTLP